MRILSSAVLVAAVLSVVAVPGEAATPGYVATVRADCARGSGSIELRQEQVSDELTHVVITGRGVANGSWKGVYGSDASGASEADETFRFDVEDRSFRLELDVEAPADGFPMTLLYSRAEKSSCMVGYRDGRRVLVTGGETMLISRFPDAGTVAVRGFVPCDKGSRVRWAVQVSYDDSGAAAGGTKRCKQRGVWISRTVISAEDVAQVRPDAVEVVVRSGGEVHRIGWGISTPAG